MKKIMMLIIATAMVSCVSVKIQTTRTDSPGSKSKHETFSYKDGDTTYVMQKYFMVLLKKGPDRNHPKAEADAIQEQHMAHINWLAENKKISLAGPTDKHPGIAGILIFNTETLQEADSLARLDPAVKAGRLEVETVSWWAAKGSKLR